MNFVPNAVKTTTVGRRFEPDPVPSEQVAQR